MADKICPIGTIANKYFGINRDSECTEEGCGMFFKCHNIEPPVQQRYGKPSPAEGITGTVLLSESEVTSAQAVVRDAKLLCLSMLKEGYEPNEDELEDNVSELQLLYSRLGGE
jgi:hypothetical protein